MMNPTILLFCCNSLCDLKTVVKVRGLQHQSHMYPIKVRNPFPRGGDFRVLVINYWKEQDTKDRAMVQRIQKVQRKMCFTACNTFYVAFSFLHAYPHSSLEMKCPPSNRSIHAINFGENLS